MCLEIPSLYFTSSETPPDQSITKYGLNQVRENPKSKKKKKYRQDFNDLAN